MSSTILISSWMTFDSLPMSSGLKERVVEQVGKDVEGPRQVLVQGLDGKTGGLLGRKSVQMAADGIGCASNLLRTPILGPFKDHVLDEVRDAVLLFAFLARAGPQPDPTETERTTGIDSVRM